MAHSAFSFSFPTPTHLISKKKRQTGVGRLSTYVRDELNFTYCHSCKAISTEAMEVDRQIMLWERRIQIEKEMQAVLDPSAGVDVANEMQKEIHRMKLRSCSHACVLLR